MKIVPYLTKHKWFFVIGFALSFVACSLYLITLKPYYTATVYATPIKQPAVELLKVIDDTAFGVSGASSRNKGAVLSMTYKAATKQEAKNGLIYWVNRYNQWQPETIRVDRHIKELEERPKYLKYIFMWVFMSIVILFGMVLTWENRRQLFWEDENENICPYCNKSII